MRPTLFELPSLFGWPSIPIRAFGVLVALGFLAGLIWSRARARRTGRDPEVISDLFVWVLVGGVVGARLLYVAIHSTEFVAAPWRVLMVWKGGLVYYGGLFGAVGAGVWFVRRRGMSVLEMADLVTPGVWLGQAVGRIGCFLVGDDYGRPSDVAWAVSFPAEALIARDLVGVPVHPTQIYLSLNALAVFAVAAWVSRRGPPLGRVAGIGLVQYAIGRFAIENYRADDAARGIYAGLATSQWLSVPVLLTGLLLLTAWGGRSGSPVGDSEPGPPSERTPPGRADA